MIPELLQNPDLTSPLYYWEFFVNQFQTNQFFTGLLVLSIMGSLTYMLKGIPGKIYHFLRGQLTVELKIQNEDDFYDTLKLYLSQTNYVKYRCRRLTLDTNYESTADNYDRGTIARYPGCRNPHNDQSKPTGPKSLPPFTLTPMDGSHWFFYKKNIIF